MGSEEKIAAGARWLRRRSTRAKVALGAVMAVAALLLLGIFIEDHEYIIGAAECSHAAGISVLAYKLLKHRTCAGLSLKFQELTAIYLAAKICCSYVMETGVHMILDLATLIATLWVVYMIRCVVRSSYMEEKDTLALYYVILSSVEKQLSYWCGGLVSQLGDLIFLVRPSSRTHLRVVPCAVIALLLHPSITSYSLITRISWAFAVYLETISVLPQLLMMQDAKVVEPFTAHYVFALGVARFLNCAHWIIRVVGSPGYVLKLLGHGHWPCLVVFCEIVQTSILADFCYYYVKSFMEGSLVMRLPSDTV